MKIQKSFLKWPGNKYSVIPKIAPLFDGCKTLIEPFAGSGVVHLNMPDVKHAIIADSNEDLITCFTSLQTNASSFIADCKSLFVKENNTKEKYLELREKFNTSRHKYDRAVYFVYLNRHGYKGLVRYNLSGGYNVPFGAYKQAYFPIEEMKQFSICAKRAEYVCADFNDLLNSVQLKDGGVYMDPPFLPLANAKTNFTSYNGRFDEEHHRALADLARLKASGHGNVVVVSNHDSPLSRAIYHGAEIIELDVARRISAPGKIRTPAKEMLAVFKKTVPTDLHFVL